MSEGVTEDRWFRIEPKVHFGLVSQHCTESTQMPIFYLSEQSVLLFHTTDYNPASPPPALYLAGLWRTTAS